jgi:hypothetical protein
VFLFAKKVEGNGASKYLLQLVNDSEVPETLVVRRNCRYGMQTLAQYKEMEL